MNANYTQADYQRTIEEAQGAQVRCYYRHTNREFTANVQPFTRPFCPDNAPYKHTHAIQCPECKRQYLHPRGAGNNWLATGNTRLKFL